MQSCFWVYIQEYEIRNLEGHLYSHVHCSIIHNSQDLDTTKWTLEDEWIKEIWDIKKWIKEIWDFPGGSDGKVSVYNAGNLGSIPGLGRFPGEEMATHSSILA